jgi:hypothetical protein
VRAEVDSNHRPPDYESGALKDVSPFQLSYRPALTSARFPKLPSGLNPLIHISVVREVHKPRGLTRTFSEQVGRTLGPPSTSGRRREGRNIKGIFGPGRFGRSASQLGSDLRARDHRPLPNGRPSSGQRGEPPVQDDTEQILRQPDIAGRDLKRTASDRRRFIAYRREHRGNLRRLRATTFL